jgi:uncharacterized protein
MAPVLLRGHHFLCILSYKGKGYSDAFVQNMTANVAAIRAGRTVQLVEGPDDICRGLTEKCRADVQHDCGAADTLRLDSLANEAVSKLLRRDLTAAEPLTAKDIARLRSEYASGTIRAACADCSWKDFCDTIVSENFAGTLL